MIDAIVMNDISNASSNVDRKKTRFDDKRPLAKINRWYTALYIVLYIVASYLCVK